MFTGLVEEIGTIKNIQSLGGGKKIIVTCKTIMDDIHIDDSISIEGVCQTVEHFSSNEFTVTAIEETLLKSTLNTIKVGALVNLERASKLSSRMGGHIVQGHTDCIGKVSIIEKLHNSLNIWIAFPNDFIDIVVPTGSIAVNGVSLTSARVNGNSFMISVIPHTIKNSTLNFLKKDDKVNLEFDIIGKYVKRILNLSTNKATISNNKTSILDQYINQPLY